MLLAAAVIEIKHHVEEKSQIIPYYDYSYRYYLCFLYPIFCLFPLLSHHPSFLSTTAFRGLCLRSPRCLSFCFVFVPFWGSCR